jgi:hypothetical protein
VRANALATGVLLAALGVAACGSVPAGPGGRHARPPAAPVTLTVADSGRTVRLAEGRTLAVVLSRQGGFAWHPALADGAALTRVSAGGGYPGQRPARAAFRAVSRGRAVLSAMDDTACLHARPSCEVAQRLWQVTVIVTRGS